MSGFFEDLDNFDGDETFLLLACAGISIVAFIQWAFRLRRISKLGCPPFQRVPLYCAFFVGLAIIGLVISRWAAQAIRDNSGYVLLVFLMGTAFLTVTAALFPWLGIGLRDDAFERRNGAAVAALSGAILAVMLIYAGANTGEGPSFWNNVYSGGIATATLLLLWLSIAVAGGAAISVAEERDMASGLRLGGFLLAAGLILARAVAGDWHSVAATTRDLIREGWPVLPLAAIAIAVEQGLRPSAGRSTLPWPTYGLLPALFYLALALAWVMKLGWWEGMKL